MKIAVVLTFFFILFSFFFSCENHWIREFTDHMFCETCGKANANCVCVPDEPIADLTGITASYNQGNTTIYLNTPLDNLKTGLTVTAIYSDGTTELVNDYTLSGTLTVGTSIITVSYSGQTSAFNVTVTAAALTGITVAYNQGSTTIYPNIPLDGLKADLTVTAEYSGGATELVNDYTLSGTLTAGTTCTITVIYGGQIASFTVTVSAVTVTSITASYNQAGAAIYPTTPLDNLKSGLTVTAEYSDSTTAILIASEYELTGTLTAGTNTITVTYGGQTTAFDVTVTAVTLTNITANYNQVSTIVFPNTPLDNLKTGLTVTAEYSDGATAILSASEYELTGTLTAGTTCTITVRCGSQTASFTVTVSLVTVTSITASYNQAGAAIYPTTPLDNLKTGLTVTAFYSDSTTAILTASEYELTGTLTAGTSTITVTYGEKTTTFPVTVTAVTLSGITASYNQGSTTVYTSTSINSLKDNLTVKAVYNNGAEETISASTYELDGELTAPTSTITVTYGEKTTTFPVKVTAVTLSGITASYIQGSTTVYTSTSVNSLKDNLTVKAVYNNGAEETLSASTYELGGELTAGTSTITVSYVEKTTTFDVEVTAVTLSGITASYNQGSTIVYLNTSLDSLKSSLTVTEVYNNGATATLSASDYTLSVSSEGTLIVGTNTITVSYGVQETTFTVNVSDAVILPDIADADDWVDALTAISGGGNNMAYTIEVTGDINIEGGNDTFGDATDITVTITGDGKLTLDDANNLRMFHISANQTLIIGETGVPGPTLQRDNNTGPSSLIAVEGGVVELRSGTITGNTGAVAGMSGGVYVNSNGVFIMSGGVISRNSNSAGGGVTLNLGSTFIMNGGVISGNNSTSPTGGGGVCVRGDSVFRMTGGIIYGDDGDTYTPSGAPNTAPNNTNPSNALFVSEGTAEYGWFDAGGNWQKVDDLDNTDKTIEVKEGVLVAPQAW